MRAMRWPRWIGVSCAILALAVCAALCAYAWLGTFTRYMTDDFCTAATLREQGFAGAMRVHRQTWSGRFSFYPIKAALEAIGPSTAPLVPGAMSLSLAAACAWVIRRTFPRAGWSVSALGGLVIAYASLDATPSRDSRFGPFLWETGAVTYMLAAVLLALWVGILRSEGSRWWTLPASATLMLLTGGLSETSLAAQAILAAGAVVLGAWLRDRRTVWLAAAGLAGTLAALVIMATAPGNAVRMAALPPRLSVLEATLRTLSMGNSFVGTQLFVDGAALVVVAAVGVLTGRGSGVRRPVAGACAAIATLAYLATFAPSAWILPAGAPARALYVTTFFSVTAVFAASVLLGSKGAAPAGGRSAAFLAAALLLSASIPVLSVVGVLRALPDARIEAAHADRVTQLLRDRRGTPVVLASRWAVASRFASEDPQHWTNRCVSRFYEIPSLRVVRR